MSESPSPAVGTDVDFPLAYNAPPAGTALNRDITGAAVDEALFGTAAQNAVAAAGAQGYGPFAVESRFMDLSEFGGASGLIQPLIVDGADAHVLTESERLGIAHRGAWDGVREVDPHTGLPAVRAYEA